MDPIAFTLHLPLIGPLVVGWYGLLTAAGFLSATLLAAFEGRRLGLFSGWQALDGALAGGACALAGGHLLYLLTPGGAQNFLRGGLVLYGAIYGGAAGIALFGLWRKIPVLEFWDAVAAPGVLPPLLGRVGCLMAGCCYGRPTDLPWGITFSDPACAAPRGMSLHPTQIYSIAGLVLLFLLLIWMSRRLHPPGWLAMTYVAGYSALRLAVELFRGDGVRGLYFGGTVSFSQLIAIPSLLAAVAAMVWLRRHAARRSP